MEIAYETAKEVNIVNASIDQDERRAMHRKNHLLRLICRLDWRDPLFLQILPFNLTADCTCKPDIGYQESIVCESRALLHLIGAVKFEKFGFIFDEEGDVGSSDADEPDPIKSDIPLIDFCEIFCISPEFLSCYRTIDGESLLSLCVAIKRDETARWLMKHVSSNIGVFDANRQSVLQLICKREPGEQRVLAATLHASMLVLRDAGTRLLIHDIIFNASAGLTLLKQGERSLDMFNPTEHDFTVFRDEFGLNGSDEMSTAAQSRVAAYINMKRGIQTVTLPDGSRAPIMNASL